MEIINGNVLNVLMADDDPDDRMFFSDAVSSLRVNAKLSTVKDGAELMQLLLNKEVPLPDMLFLDLNMPRKNGFQCLDEIRADIGLKELFVIIYSTTSSAREIAETFNKGANLFVNKPNTFSELKLILAKVFDLNLKEYSRPEKANFVLETY